MRGQSPDTGEGSYPAWGSPQQRRAGAPPAPLAGGGGARSCLPGAARVPGRAGGAEPAAARGRQRGLDGGGVSVCGGGLW